NLSWTEPEGANNNADVQYKVEISDNDNLVFPQFFENWSEGVISKLIPGTRYTVRVWSATRNPTTDIYILSSTSQTVEGGVTTLPAPLENGTLTIHNGHVSLSWDNPNGPAVDKI